KLRLSPLSPWHYKGYANRFDLTTERASALGWRPEYSNLDMLKEAYDSYLEDKGKSDLNSIHSKALKQGIIKIIRKLS
ncbi:MAG: NAD(P)-dependent oxidoreductase, partial [Candidatus Paceibacterota bacterium]